MSRPAPPIDRPTSWRADNAALKRGGSLLIRFDRQMEWLATPSGKMRCLKLLGERLPARTFDRQAAELQIRIALLNRFTALGPPETKRVA